VPIERAAAEELTGEQLGERAPMRRVAVASAFGSTIEYYDFFLYGTAAALVFPQLFFPEAEPVVGTLASFGTFAVGFVARPLGGIVCGHYGDRVGRKAMLIITLMLMGLSTAAIGLLPTYATIGVWAPVLLTVLRFVQGFSFGGELGGAALLTVEHAPRERRGFWGKSRSWGRRSARASRPPCCSPPPSPCPTRRSWPGAGASRSCSAS
jgi:MFS transporter, MHS family, shikimate and dehydroshikimate transport protein